MFLPTYRTDRLRRTLALPPDGALVTARHDGRRRVVDGACAAARALGLHPGMPLAQAQALTSGLQVAEADPAAEATGLRRLASWAQAFSPLTAPDPPDGLWLESTGCDHLHGGEAAMLDALCGRLAQAGLAARAAVADTPGAAHALARHAETARTVAPPRGQRPMLEPLPVTALRLAPETVAALRRVGLERIGQLAGQPRAPLVRRFGADLARRLDQALNEAAEPIAPLLPPAVFAQRMAFLEPLLTADSFAAVIAELTRHVCGALEREGQGARRLDLLFQRIDGSWQAIRIGTSRPARAARHLARLLSERLPGVDPGLGVEAMQLVVSLAEPLAYAQTSTEAAENEAGLAELVDRLVGRLGADAVYRTAPVESDVPGRAVRRVPPLAPPVGSAWPDALPRPARLLDPPQPVDAMALLPDHPPVQFTWRKIRRTVRRADGPERVFGEWWARDGEVWAVRDYFAVEDEAGRRWWLYRRGDGVDADTGDLAWFLHGIF